MHKSHDTIFDVSVRISCICIYIYSYIIYYDTTNMIAKQNVVGYIEYRNDKIISQVVPGWET